ncbi:LpxL/LpxP family Kdo(2)-lipid IV(A) lauroyl/palmitoleoyl acyltransferase [Xylella taiwanensis]|uniref:Lipid A biosynthesis acyltransferase n=1 Tax=Xylella taiwanensis TaxID=1444770 RepID=Z9JGY2_9GAMM|nr:LpxL/LpxP family Kdo(2)-lipid IV(A) lauroyl/palmitoleoyl acyltransferase [Xylella taiwanensis]AXI82551.1 lipid A biosynthesis lauroyl acyltransferase [Xylella taiwanensis]EWS77660.1 lauroyl acyltransferase [Xylella taiwanensis]MCD8455542.1 LpxL/LpxP family Kdo(2)-lipid IV(A) lauroyl/palmitoleoyl acyltransferase [Xylella taiwanensis]MCD8457950.1 LpxL/LpxP family Kdo(2)-lipid IV(A) lauroyl/palmitoleoyl acyltransferase [Xylella taiwanensis]MCD8460084.1 LpxL/LpxP family Kdo(2)-lipid IV(A) lauro
MSEFSDVTPRPSLLKPAHWPMYLALCGMVIAARLPWGLQHLLGRMIGPVALRLLRTRRHAAEVNLRLCFPQHDEAWRQNLLRKNFDALGVGLFEFARAWWGTIDVIRAGIRLEGLEHLRQLQREGRGVLLVSGHFMTLEICGRLLCDYVPLAGMYRRHRHPVLEWAVKRGRLRYATHMFANEELRATIKHLKRGGFLWYAPDQDMRGKDTVFAPFFGMPAATITATHQLARLTGCAVVPYFHRRQGSDYVLKIAPPLTDFPSDDMAADTARVNQVIEAMIQEAPDQYLWVHRRFKRQPDGHSSFYD